MNDVNNNNVKKGNGDTKRITITLVLILTLMVTVTGGTYAYLYIGATATNNMTGTVATGSLAFQLSNNATTTSGIPDQVSPPKSGAYASSPMVPQYAYNNSKNTLQLAVTGVKPPGSTSVVPCVDGNGNVICRIYTFTIRNNATATAMLNGTIKFSGVSTSTVANLKWALMTSGTAVTITSSGDANIHSASTTATNFVTSLRLIPSGGASSTSAACPSSSSSDFRCSYKQFWFVFWIQETGAVQSDNGTWYATIEFKDSNNKGITSTITGA
ncbi:MAG: hypothetical protein VZS44_03785 [Bacilli bacterium]|nr:hypothetical protein [Bacilli bacterium]